MWSSPGQKIFQIPYGKDIVCSTKLWSCIKPWEALVTMMTVATMTWQICIFNNKKKTCLACFIQFYPVFHFCTFCSCSCCINNFEWLVLQLCDWQTYFHFYSWISMSFGENLCANCHSLVLNWKFELISQSGWNILASA